LYAQNYAAGRAAGLRFYVEEQGGEAAVLRATAGQREENRKRGFIVEVGFSCPPAGFTRYGAAAVMAVQISRSGPAGGAPPATASSCRQVRREPIAFALLEVEQQVL